MKGSPTITRMLVDLRSAGGDRLGRIELDADERPTRIRLPASDRDLYLSWDGAVDDGGHLRSCIACGHSHLYRSKSFPQVTPFVVVLAFAGAALALLGYATDWWILFLLAIVLVLDILVLFLAEPRLACYRCGSIYRRLKIARYHTPWDGSLAEKTVQEQSAEEKTDEHE